MKVFSSKLFIYSVIMNILKKWEILKFCLVDKWNKKNCSGVTTMNKFCQVFLLTYIEIYMYFYHSPVQFFLIFF